MGNRKIFFFGFHAPEGIWHRGNTQNALVTSTKFQIDHGDLCKLLAKQNNHDNLPNTFSMFAHFVQSSCLRIHDAMRNKITVIFARYSAFVPTSVLLCWRFMGSERLPQFVQFYPITRTRSHWSRILLWKRPERCKDEFVVVWYKWLGHQETMCNGITPEKTVRNGYTQRKYQNQWDCDGSRFKEDGECIDINSMDLVCDRMLNRSTPY